MVAGSLEDAAPRDGPEHHVTEAENQRELAFAIAAGDVPASGPDAGMVLGHHGHGGALDLEDDNDNENCAPTTAVGNAMLAEGEGENHAAAAGDTASASTTERTESAERGRQTNLRHWLL